MKTILLQAVNWIRLRFNWELQVQVPVLHPLALEETAKRSLILLTGVSNKRRMAANNWLPFSFYIGFCGIPVCRIISSGKGCAYLFSLGSKIYSFDPIFRFNTISYPSLFKRLISIQRSPRKTNSFLLSTNIRSTNSFPDIPE